ncbi:MAG: lytic murein transglycosylase [Vicinamibacterales bacterium]|nr:lytic murein transglycosylase [Vicinamibacterales bacterium]
MPRLTGFVRVAGGACAAWLAAAIVVMAATGHQDAARPQASAPPAEPFREWLAGVREEALARGISARTIDAALTDVAPLPVVVERDRTQAELTLNLDLYLRRRLPPSVVRSARTMARTHREVLRRVEAAYGVPPSVVTAIWGLESNFGRFTGVRPTIPALATLAHDGRRVTLFREELLAALTIVDRGDVPLSRLKGSWAGAMGQPQFMPSTYLSDAVDFDGDGRRDIWASTADVFGSIANYLHRRGWVAGQRWGREVAVSERAAARVAGAVPLRMSGACRAVRDMTEARPLTEWARLGVTLPKGHALPASAITASLARVDRRTFLVYGNYEALLAYNCAHTYALSVAMLADRIR